LQARIKEINEDSNYKTVIAAAGGAAHLPGVVAAMTVKPVIGVPVPTSFNSGLDSLLSICQMPGGIPVATFAVGKSGPKNAALYALQIIGLQDEIIATKLQEFRKLMNEQVQADNAAIQNK
jgi:5-(carboxyamino)imidazole ribonucleotide mutase